MDVVSSCCLARCIAFAFALLNVFTNVWFLIMLLLVPFDSQLEGSPIVVAQNDKFDGMYVVFLRAISITLNISVLVSLVSSKDVPGSILMQLCLFVPYWSVKLQ